MSIIEQANWNINPANDWVDRLLSLGYEVKRLRNSFENFMAGIQISLGNIRGR